MVISVQFVALKEVKFRSTMNTYLKSKVNPKLRLCKFSSINNYNFVDILRATAQSTSCEQAVALYI